MMRVDRCSIFQAKLDRTGACGRSFVVKAATLAAMAALAFVYAAPAHANRLRPGLRSTAPSQRALSQALAQTTGLSPSQVTSEDICPAARPGHARCAGQALILRSSHALVRPHARRHGTLGRVRPAFIPGFAAPATASASSSPATGHARLPPAGLRPRLPFTDRRGRRHDRDHRPLRNPNAESDLATYRGHVRAARVHHEQRLLHEGQPERGHHAPVDARRHLGMEESLDLDAVSALCPNCRILLVEANSAIPAT